MTEWQSIAGKVAIVYGGSLGVGLGISRALSAAGAMVVIVARNKTQGLEAVSNLQTPGLFVQGDVALYDNHVRIIDETVRMFQKLDIIVCCAGIYPDIPIESKDFDEDYIERMIGVNLKGSIFAVKTALPHLQRQGEGEGGRVIFISSSTGAFTGASGCAMYGAAKAAQIGFARSAAVELQRHNITVSCVLPGWNVNDFPSATNRRNSSSDTPEGFHSLDTPDEIGRVVLRLIMGKSSSLVYQRTTMSGSHIRMEKLDVQEGDDECRFARDVK